jgi:hypothetical protein
MRRMESSHTETKTAKALLTLREPPQDCASVYSSPVPDGSCTRVRWLEIDDAEI